jgi:hypothetical protein
MSNTAIACNLREHGDVLKVRYFDETNGLDKSIQEMLNTRLEENLN